MAAFVAEFDGDGEVGGVCDLAVVGGGISGLDFREIRQIGEIWQIWTSENGIMAAGGAGGGGWGGDMGIDNWVNGENRERGPYKGPTLPRQGRIIYW